MHNIITKGRSLWCYFSHFLPMPYWPRVAHSHVIYYCLCWQHLHRSPEWDFWSINQWSWNWVSWRWYRIELFVKIMHTMLLYWNCYLFYNWSSQKLPLFGGRKEHTWDKDKFFFIQRRCLLLKGISVSIFLSVTWYVCYVKVHLWYVVNISDHTILTLLTTLVDSTTADL